MNDQQLNSYRNRLRALSSRTRVDVAAVREQALAPGGGQADGGLSNAPMHLGDVGTETYLQELNGALLENEEYLLTETMAAIARIDDGTFGICEGCGKPIAKDRLDALPYSRHCTSCAQTLRPGPAVSLNAGRPEIETVQGRISPADRRQARDSTPTMPGSSSNVDTHASGTAGGGTAVGGLAGTNVGRGDPDDADLEGATGTGQFDAKDANEDEDEPRSGRAGGTVGGPPAGKRAAGGKMKPDRARRKSTHRKK